MLYSLCNERCDDSIALHSWVHCAHCTPLLYCLPLTHFAIFIVLNSIALHCCIRVHSRYLHHSIAVLVTPFHCSTGQLVVPSIVPTPTSYSHKLTKHHKFSNNYNTNNRHPTKSITISHQQYQQGVNQQQSATSWCNEILRSCLRLFQPWDFASDEAEISAVKLRSQAISQFSEYQAESPKTQITINFFSSTVQGMLAFRVQRIFFKWSCNHSILVNNFDTAPTALNK